MVLPEAVWYSVVSDTAEAIFTRYARGLPLRGQAVVAPSRLHFTIIALTVDQGTLVGQKFHELTCGKDGIL